MIDCRLPLVDLHRHLDGNIRPATIWELARQHHISLPVGDLKSLIPLTQVQDKTSDLMAFLAKLNYGVSVLADYEACYRVAYENVQDAQKSGLDYAELRFSPGFMAQAFELNQTRLVEAVIAGVTDACAVYPVKINLIGILSRTYGAQACQRELNALLAHQSHIVGLDLAGDELNFPAQQFVSHFNQARDAGWQITIHAGEADGPDSVWNAIKLLGASRIGHGVAASNDEALMDYMATHNIAIESCPTSNYQTATVSDLSLHPMKIFMQRGVPVTLNTDDPAVSDIDIQHEYHVARTVIGLSVEQLQQVQRAGLEAAFLSVAEKQFLLSKTR